MKHKNKGFTLVEVMTAVTIIVILVALLLPALRMVRRLANETAQKAQFAAIDMAIMAFKNDFGDYPPSGILNSLNNYCGEQKLTEALLGWDLLGFHPKSVWRADGTDGAGGLVYSSMDPNLAVRRGPYLETSKANVFRLGDIQLQNKPGLFNNTKNLAPDTFVMCDVFATQPVRVGAKTVKAGTPILYYKANTSSRTIDPPTLTSDRIYDAYDNFELLDLGTMPSRATLHPLATFVGGEYTVFYDSIRDPKITTINWPYRPDSYILISAGADGLYGTSDDIHNF